MTRAANAPLILPLARGVLLWRTGRQRYEELTCGRVDPRGGTSGSAAIPGAAKARGGCAMARWERLEAEDRRC